MDRGAGLPIEIDGARHAPPGFEPGAFLRDYWQRRPLLVRRAFPRFVAPLGPAALTALAGRCGESARLVRYDPRGDRWTLRHGPFDAGDFARLPARDWTLLVQDCDKYVPAVRALLARFRFVPSWRIDDVMISYAADRGSVGAHVDQYDVFLLQGLGRRRWEICVDRGAATAFRADAPLRLLVRFEPTHRFVLEPGDMLYLPPGVPHHGVAEGPCMTLSIGMRAPSLAELLLDWSEARAETLGDARRYADPGIDLPTDPARIGDDALARVAALLREASALDDEALATWFGRFITRYRSAGAAPGPARPLGAAALLERLGNGRGLRRAALSRYAWRSRGARGAELFFAGEAFRGTRRLARWLDRDDRFDARRFARLSASERATLVALFNAGHLEIARA